MSLNQIIGQVTAFNCATVCVTGGEPLAQKACLDLLAALCNEGFSVSLETSGALDISGVDARVARIMDIKAPDSGESAKNRWQNCELLTAHDEIKFVLASREDYQWAVAASHQHRLFARCPVLFSPVQGSLDPALLAQWVLDDCLPVRFQLQLHKVLWGNVKGR